MVYRCSHSNGYEEFCLLRLTPCSPLKIRVETTIHSETSEQMSHFTYLEGRMTCVLRDKIYIIIPVDMVESAVFQESLRNQNRSRNTEEI
jgi:hypothetical protein